MFRRYYAICHPLRARHVHTTTRALMLVAIIWVTSLVLLSPQLVIQRLEPLLVLQPHDEPPIRVAEVQNTPRPSKNRTTFIFRIIRRNIGRMR